MEGSHSGQLHEFRKLEEAIPPQVQILYPPPSLAMRASPQEYSPIYGSAADTSAFIISTIKIETQGNKSYEMTNMKGLL